MSLQGHGSSTSDGVGFERLGDKMVVEAGVRSHPPAPALLHFTTWQKGFFGCQEGGISYLG